jgi:hypothetical protein
MRYLASGLGVQIQTGQLYNRYTKSSLAICICKQLAPCCVSFNVTWFYVQFLFDSRRTQVCRGLSLDFVCILFGIFSLRLLSLVGLLCVIKYQNE